MVELEQNYTLFSRVYDEVMDDSLYEKWLDFSERHFPARTHKVLELACGTGILSQKFVAKHYDVTGVDLSKEMMDLAKKRVTNAEFEQCDMRELRYQSEFDAVTCYSDSLCYLTDLSEVKKTFDGVHRALRQGGIFIFDVHSTYQTDALFPGFAYHDNAEDFAFVWDTYAGEEAHSVAHELTFFVKSDDGKFVRKDELHEERTYEIADYLTALSNFSDVKVFADFTDNAPEAKSLRWFFVCQK
ncbi:class I SAM-dependent DNA methyltransferase [Lactococcus nasutitermitis]|uniref:Class I SAM-dependent DNA methyltransferase n=1 Tax=Lactococcus nasutitermitis TaxID=1652957 RepID=A0ABV9JE98_9LACT|nr:class I SAM-dependent methyltransferase [Lactococcus nasutitermitis]